MPAHSHSLTKSGPNARASLPKYWVVYPFEIFAVKFPPPLEEGQGGGSTITVGECGKSSPAPLPKREGNTSLTFQTDTLPNI